MPNYRIAHFIYDEKFPDHAYGLFETVLPGGNDYYLPSKKQQLKFIKKIPVKFISKFSCFNPFFINSLKKYDFVVLHSLTHFNRLLVLLSYRHNIRFVWVGLGNDYYDLISDSEELLLLEHTRKIYKSLLSLRHNLSPTHALKYLFRKLLCNTKLKLKTINKIDFFAPVLPIEYDILKKKYANFKPRYAFWNYGTNAAFIDTLNHKKPKFNNNNILLGNSASPNNNHKEIIDYLILQNLGERRVICPLSYGMASYANHISNYGRASLVDCFLPIQEFLSYKEYMHLISSCSIVIMNHVRQQAAGNISAMLAIGAKVFLREENPLYFYYKNLGFKIFSIQELLVNSHLLNSNLSDEEIHYNQSLLISNYSSTVELNKTKALIELCTNNSLN